MKFFTGKSKTALTLLAASILGLGLLSACNKDQANTNSGSSTASVQSSQTSTQEDSKVSEKITTAEDLQNISDLAVFVLTDLKTQLELSDEELKSFVASANKFVDGSAKTLSEDEAKKLNGYLTARAQKVMLANLQKQAEVNGKAGEEAIAKFLADNPNAVKDESGIVYVIENPGKGEQVRATDTVKVKYKGSFVDGRVFDQNDQGIEFPLNGVIPGFSQAITKLKVGGKILVLIPPALAYGEQGNQAIPPRSTLQFEIEVLSRTPEAPAKK
ncbi:FKBP-type peptidyl-prolyl cis-trans isomerase [Psittacicella hinzii]|uniref:FKBP-type peptidyl-prolyl cis-trans isomerase n=1 Tax=Psittacicella hinzii TaxID=2028575 RepID=UPI003615F0AB